MSRVERVQRELEKQNAEGLLVTKDVNRRYVSGFTGTAGAVLVTKSEAFFITDFRYAEQAKAEVKEANIIIHKGNLLKEIGLLVDKLALETILIEENGITFKSYLDLKEYTSASLLPSHSLIEKIREIKDSTEMEKMYKAAEIADETFAHIINFIKPGLTEIEVRNELELHMRKLGATSSSFNIIVASGERAALPHGIASHKVIENGDMITLDFGAVYEGYCSDITRTVSVGKPTEKFQEIYNIVLEALERGTKGICSQKPTKEIDRLARCYIDQHGYGENFGHSTGHGLGLEVHEPLRLSSESEEVLQKGMVVTVEPGIYIPGWGGCRIEDDILVTDNGYELLTKSSRELIIL
ncbi:M24 family metallopeptidase [Bacillus seohaeanensis]|uniref:M24 family metallopeptidase n=1 Tax=Bacillus seohaeanensis TaxID=284580 RepID=A0ABW5RL94_9BACI